MNTLFQKFVQFVLRPKWVKFHPADESGVHEPELGLQIWGVIFALYKAEVYIPSNPTLVAAPAKREFGESLHPLYSENQMFAIAHTVGGYAGNGQDILTFHSQQLAEQYKNRLNTEDIRPGSYYVVPLEQVPENLRPRESRQQPVF